MLDDWSRVDVEHAKAFIASCRVRLVFVIALHRLFEFSFNRYMKVDMVKYLFVKLRMRNFTLNLLSLADYTFMVLLLNTGGMTYIALASLYLAPPSAENDPLTPMEKAYHKWSLTICDGCFDTLKSSKMQS